MNWYTIQNIQTIDTPALVFYKQRISDNISKAISLVKNINLLRPHIKTNKTPEVCAMMMEQGITKFKCATIAEAEMLAMINARDVLLAYQPVGPKATRLLNLSKLYPGTTFSCIVDDYETAKHLSTIFQSANEFIEVYIDLNTGMNRTGIIPRKAFALVEKLFLLPGIRVKGIHVYDGHLASLPEKERINKINSTLEEVGSLLEFIEGKTNTSVNVVAGGSPSFLQYRNSNVESSPGTFVFWDWGYKQLLPGEPFDFAALVITRIVSIVDHATITTDLGHKSVAAENPLPRVYFLNAPETIALRQNEEHLVLQVPDSSIFKTGDVLYGVPVHICPTVALYEKGNVVEDNVVTTTWDILARNRCINV
jgi:D-serine deaminase-like pyridoxal phosphate-dependent protein